MILVTRLNGAAFAVNPDLLERVEATPDTVLTLIDGTKYLVSESVADVIELVRDYRASVVASARGWHSPDEAGPRDHRADHRPRLHLAAGGEGGTVTPLPATPRDATRTAPSDTTQGQEED